MIPALLAAAVTLAPPASFLAEKDVEAEVSAHIAKQRIPGLSIAIAQDGRVVWSKGFGLADVENDVPVVPATVFRIASSTKPITAVAVMQLVERGQLDLDAPIQRYVPSFPAKPWRITPYQLLAHLGGIRNYRSDDFGGEPDNARPYKTLVEALDVFKDDPLDAEPGTRYGYTTFGYTLLGTAVEGASGATFVEYLRENVFKRAGMVQTRTDSPYDLIPHRARGYTRLGVREKFVGRPPSGPLRNSDFMDSSYKIPGGGLVSTAEDMVRFAIAVEEGALVKPETLARMTTRQRTRSGEETPYGLGWYVGGPGDRPGAFWHGGVQKGVTSTIYLEPKNRFAVAILTNLEGGGMLGLEALAGRLAEIVTRPRPPSSPPDPS